MAGFRRYGERRQVRLDLLRPGASEEISISTGTFPVQSLWSNAFNSGVGGCVLSY